jgi:hypothetical protein
MFLPLDKITKGSLKKVGVGKHSDVRAALLDLRNLMLSLASRPTNVSELIKYTSPRWRVPVTRDAQ